MPPDCARLSTASMLWFVGYEDIANFLMSSEIPANNFQIREIHCLIYEEFLNNRKLSNRYGCQLIDVRSTVEFDILQETTMGPDDMAVVALLSSDSQCDHMVGIMRGLIFDSNMNWAMTLSRENLDLSCSMGWTTQTTFEKVYYGYHYYPIKCESISSSRHRKRHLHCKEWKKKQQQEETVQQPGGGSKEEC